MALSEFTQETRAKLNDLLKYWKKWEHVKDDDVLQLLDSIATGYGGKVVDRQIDGRYKIRSIISPLAPETSVYNFHLTILLDECANKFDLDKVKFREGKNIRVFFKGVSKDNSHKVIMVFNLRKIF